MNNENRLDLIDRTALLAKKRELELCFAVTEHDIENAPRVDAVEVVRCKDCVQFDKRMFESVCCRTRYLVKENDYCSFGKRDD